MTERAEVKVECGFTLSSQDYDVELPKPLAAALMDQNLTKVN